MCICQIEIVGWTVHWRTFFLIRNITVVVVQLHQLHTHTVQYILLYIVLFNVLCIYVKTLDSPSMKPLWLCRRNTKKQPRYWGFHEKGTPSYLGALGWIDCRHWMSVHWKYLFYEIICNCTILKVPLYIFNNISFDTVCVLWIRVKWTRSTTHRPCRRRYC